MLFKKKIHIYVKKESHWAEDCVDCSSVYQFLLSQWSLIMTLLENSHKIFPRLSKIFNVKFKQAVNCPWMSGQRKQCGETKCPVLGCPSNQTFLGVPEGGAGLHSLGELCWWDSIFTKSNFLHLSRLEVHGFMSQKWHTIRIYRRRSPT